jgi:amino acid adenylation domain-containing protein
MAERIEERLRAAAARRPDAVALVKGERRLTYRELCERMDDAAGAVAAANTGGGPVAIHAAKTIDTIVCMMGCLAAGVPYVPVDASLPPARRAAVLDRAGSTLFLYDGGEIRATPGVAESSAEVMDIASLADVRTGGRVLERSEVAYILFTSGSTGTPKGVVTTHANLLTAMEWTEPFFGWGPEETVLCYAPLHFDMYPIDVYGSLGAGATVVLAGDREVFFPQAIADLVRAHGITQFLAVPSAWIGLLRLDPGDGPDPLASLRLVIYSGEEFPAGWLRQLAERLPKARIINVYGLVETNSVIGFEIRPEHLALDRIPLGYPLGPNHVYLLGDDGVPLTGPGIQGEIAVHGPSLSPRYLNDPVTTKATWSELVDADGTRRPYFRTGDFGEYGDDGIIHYRGRRDARIKTRGHRVELGDVEAALASHPAVLLAVAVPRPRADVTNELVAFVESHDASLGESEIIAWARQLLPAYMVPREIVVTDALPRTATGKADRQTLRRQVLG